MSKILLIKTGAAGDVVRTTTLLNALQASITWVIDDRYRELLPQNHAAISRILSPQQAKQDLQYEGFDCTISLEEDPVCADLASSITTRELTGIYSKNGQIFYTENAAGWFDMSLISRLGRQTANDIKWRNTHTFQHLLFSMLGLSFTNEPYCIYRDTTIQPGKDVIGIETRAGARWPNKGWSGYHTLIKKLQQDGYRCKVLQQQKTIRDYLDEIAGCACIISGDTLAMHVAMAYRIPSIALFNCTSPAEIHDYGTMVKVINPMLRQAFYSTGFSQAVTNAILAEEVYEAFMHHALLQKV